MAISQKDPENWPHNVHQYDPEARGKTLNRTVFDWVTVTIDRVWPDGNSYGIKFVEDVSRVDEETQERTGGDIWNLYGPWNEKTGRSDPYLNPGENKGYEYAEGQVVDVQLQMSETKRNDGSTGQNRAVTRKPKSKDGKPGALNIRMNNEYARTAPPPAEAPPAQQPAVQQSQEEPVAAEGYLTLDQKIAKAQCLNIIKDFHLAGKSEDIGLSPDASKEIVRNESMRLAQGKAVDLSYLSPLVAVAIENGGIVLEITDSSAPDFEDAPEGENVEKLEW